MKKTPLIYGFGSACVDYRIHIPDMGTGYTAKVIADSIHELGGGACANCLVQAARLGAECSYLGKLGSDPQAHTILSLFKSENIHTELIKTGDEQLSPFNVAVYKGENYERVGGYLLPNSLGSISCNEAAELAERVVSGSEIIVEIGEIPLESVLAFLKAVRSKSTRIVIDVDLDPVRQLNAPLKLFEEILSIADVLIPNYEAVEFIYENNSHFDLAGLMAEKFQKTVIVTAGENGVCYCEPGGKPVHIPADKIDIVDTVGAGDSFHGAFLYAIGTGHDIESSIGFAMECAQKTCAGFGARTSMPYKSDLSK